MIEEKQVILLLLLHGDNLEEYLWYSLLGVLVKSPMYNIYTDKTLDWVKSEINISNYTKGYVFNNCTHTIIHNIGRQFFKIEDDGSDKYLRPGVGSLAITLPIESVDISYLRAYLNLCL